VKYLFLILLTSCSALRVDYAVVREGDDLSGSIQDIQRSASYETMDLGRGLLFSSFAGIGLGFYESRIFYTGRSFPGQTGQFWDWYRSPHSGDAWMKIGDSDKAFRYLWTSSLYPARLAFIRYFGGNWLLAAIAEWIVTNTVATIVRSYGKHGELRLSLDLSLPHLK
jgi:hypothetical protein